MIKTPEKEIYKGDGGGGGRVQRWAGTEVARYRGGEVQKVARYRRCEDTEGGRV